jgi:hypothetical protein
MRVQLARGKHLREPDRVKQALTGGGRILLRGDLNQFIDVAIRHRY